MKIALIASLSRDKATPDVHFHPLGIIRSDLQQMKSEIENISNKLDTLMTHRGTEDEGQF